MPNLPEDWFDLVCIDGVLHIKFSVSADSPAGQRLLRKQEGPLMLNSQYTYLQDQNGNPILGRTQHNSTQVVLVVDLLSDFRVLAITREQAEELTARGKMLT